MTKKQAAKKAAPKSHHNFGAAFDVTDEAAARILLYVLKHGNVYPGAVDDAQAFADDAGFDFNEEALVKIGGPLVAEAAPV